MKSDIYALCKARLNANGIGFDQVKDTQEAEHRMSRLERPSAIPQLAFSQHDFTESNSFWLFLTDLKSGQDIGSMGAKLEDLKHEKFGPYINRQLARYYRDEDIEFDASHEVPINIGGSLIYMGDLQLQPEYWGLEKIHLRALIFLMYSLGTSEWPDFDYIYALIAEKHFNLGFAGTYQANQMAMTPTYWQREPKGRKKNDYILALDRAGLEYYFRLYIGDEELFDSYINASRSVRNQKKPQKS